MKTTFKYKLELLPILFLIILVMGIPVGLYFAFYEDIQERDWNTEFIEWTGILLYIPIVLSIIYQIGLRLFFRFEIADNEITIVKPGLKRVYSIDEFGGYRKQFKKKKKEVTDFQFYGINNTSMLFSINSSLIENKEEFFEVVHSKFKDLSIGGEATETDQKVIEQNEIFHNLPEDVTLKEAQKKFKLVKTITIGFTVTAAIMLLSPLLSAFPAFTFIYPILLVNFLFQNKKWVRLYQSSGGQYPFLIIALILSSIATAIHTGLIYYMNFSLMFWLYSILFGLIYFFILLRGSFEYKKQQLSMLEAGFIVVLCFMYGIGFTTTLNCAMDFNTPQVVSPFITELIPDGPAIEVEDFDSFEGPIELPVYQSFYNTLEPGDQVYIHVRPGLLGFPWFYEMNFK